jgi:carbon starvation protein
MNATTDNLPEIERQVGGESLRGRTGGAVTLAVGMSQIFTDAMRRLSFGHLDGHAVDGVIKYWFHFAIMFEALFILTTIDAGTRVGRFLVQDFLGMIAKPLGDTKSFAGNTLATALFVGAWGWFLYQGVIDPLGGINSLWPIFGVANQLLAVIAFALGTTVLIKMGRKRYAWVTLAPLAWLLAVTMTAGWMKIFSAAPVGFLAIARGLEQKISAGGSATDLALWKAQLLNNRIDAAVTGTFLVLVLVVLIANARVWWQLLAGKRVAQLREEPYIALATAGR